MTAKSGDDTMHIDTDAIISQSRAAADPFVTYGYYVYCIGSLHSACTLVRRYRPYTHCK